LYLGVSPVFLDCPFLIVVGTILEHWRKPKVHSRRDNPGKLEKTQGTMKKGQSRNTGENPRYNEEGTIQENWRKPKVQSRRDNS
jgi:hypothetical protein